MIKTYHGTWMRPNLAEAKVVLYFTESVKWEAEEEEEVKVELTGVKSWSIVDGEEAKLIEAETDEDGIDENHEYLILRFANGEESTYRNSHVAMFIL